LLLVALVVVAAVTAVLNLDTSVFFLTPVLLHLARTRGLDERAFLYGAIFMSNSASLFLPGSNLTNLIVLHGERVSGALFFARLCPAAIASVLATAGVLLAWFWRPLGLAIAARDEHIRARIGIGAAAVAISAVLVLVLRQPALPVLALGVAAVVAARVPPTHLRAAIDAPLLAGLFALAVALGALGRSWGGPQALFDSLDRWQTAVGAAFASVLVNNLPAAVLLSPEPPPHARALLIGLNIGPNLAVTGSLSALLWLRVSRSLGADPSIRVFSAIGVVLAPVTIAAALLATSL
jgi:arsenical pump membrane protein